MSSAEEVVRERVREVIHRSGMTNAQFAERVHMDPPKLSKSLGGARRFTSFELASVAAEGGTTIDWLLGGEEPRTTVATRHRDASPTAINHALDRAEAYAEADVTLRRLHDQATTLPPLPHLPLDPLAIKAGPALADHALSVIEQAGQRHLLEKDPASVIETVFGLNVAVEAFDDGLDGITYVTDDFRLILINSRISWSRQRFTLAHELAHVLAGDGESSDGVCVDRDVMATRTEPGRISEVRANAFAAAFLMPDDRVRAAFAGGIDETTFAEAVGRFTVSPSALAWRMVNLGLIDADIARPFLAMPMQLAVRLGNWAARFDELTVHQNRPRPPAPLAARGAQALLDGKIGVRPLAAILNAPPETLLPSPGGADLAGEEPVFAP
jgi:Zn-dependent peptidase ImmA (M78 family)